MNAARYGESYRLQKMYEELLWVLDKGATTRQLARATGSCAVHTDISELRQNGIPITCTYEGTRNGRRIYRYKLEE